MRVGASVEEQVLQRFERKHGALDLLRYSYVTLRRRQALRLQSLHRLLQDLLVQLSKRREEQLGESHYVCASARHALGRKCFDDGVEKEERACEDEPAGRRIRMGEAGLKGREQGVREDLPVSSTPSIRLRRTSYDERLASLGRNHSLRPWLWTKRRLPRAVDEETVSVPSCAASIGALTT